MPLPWWGDVLLVAFAVFSAWRWVPPRRGPAASLRHAVGRVIAWTALGAAAVRLIVPVGALGAIGVPGVVTMPLLLALIVAIPWCIVACQRALWRDMFSGHLEPAVERAASASGIYAPDHPVAGTAAFERVTGTAALSLALAVAPLAFMPDPGEASRHGTAIIFISVLVVLAFGVVVLLAGVSAARWRGAWLVQPALLAAWWALAC